jgi:GNAT superfamily N-acetyltransferase
VTSRWHHILPGRLRVERGSLADYRALEHFHYAPGQPAVPAGVWRVVYSDRGPWSSHHPKSRTPNPKSSRLVAVAVLTFPTPASRARERALNLTGPRYGRKLALVNAHVRTIARVIVHPQFRGLGLAARLVRRVCEQCPTRYVEAFAAMGEVHPFFEQAGMRRVEPAHADEAAYFIFDREEGGRHAE